MTELEIQVLRDVLERIITLTEMYPNYVTEQIALVANVGVALLSEDDYGPS